jgi:uncharacterized protein YdeI (YjbR/CyaY-like superfamily)
VRRRRDDESYTIRFTPRRRRSTWSAVNVARVAELEAAGLMRPAGLEAFARRSDDRTAIYSYEQRRTAELGEAYEAELRADPDAWAFFQAQPPWYRRAVAQWVTSAKREETRRRRLAQLIADSAQGRTVPPLTRPGR